MRKTLLTLFISLLSIAAITAQNKKEIALDVAGLNPDKNFTDTEIRKALGQPTKFILSDNDEGGKDRAYHYGPPEKYDFFEYQANQGCLTFTLKTPTYSLFKGRIKVGNTISKLSTLEGGYLEKKSQKLYYFHPLGYIAECFLIITTNDEKIITAITYNPPL